jgi:hypothetical protein
MRPIRVFVAPGVEDRPQANVARLQAIPRFEKKWPWHSLIRLTGGWWWSLLSTLLGLNGQTMAKDRNYYHFSVKDIAQAVGKSVGAVNKDRQRGKFDPEYLRSLAEYVMKHAVDPNSVQVAGLKWTTPSETPCNAA